MAGTHASDARVEWTLEARVAAPIIASFYAVAGNAASINAGSYPYTQAQSLFELTPGSNGSYKRCV
jgi:hypothetical protein